jgi:hypothetical protein
VVSVYLQPSEPEPPDPVAAWFCAHYALLEAAGTLITRLDGAGPEVGVPPSQGPPLPAVKPLPLQQYEHEHEPCRPPDNAQRKRPRRNYVVSEGRCVRSSTPPHLVARPLAAAVAASGARPPWHS